MMQIFPDSVGGTMNAYTLFYQACREEHKNRFPDESVKGHGFKVFKLYCATPRSLKGAVSRGRFFCEGFNILISTFCFCVCADGFQGLSKAFHYPTIIRFYFFFEIIY
jgi:hypothetical protein